VHVMAFFSLSAEDGSCEAAAPTPNATPISSKNSNRCRFILVPLARPTNFLGIEDGTISPLIVAVWIRYAYAQRSLAILARPDAIAILTFNVPFQRVQWVLVCVYPVPLPARLESVARHFGAAVLLHVGNETIVCRRSIWLHPLIPFAECIGQAVVWLLTWGWAALWGERSCRTGDRPPRSIIQAAWVNKTSRLVFHVCIKILPAIKLDRVFANESPIRLVVVSGAIVI